MICLVSGVVLRMTLLTTVAGISFVRYAQMQNPLFIVFYIAELFIAHISFVFEFEAARVLVNAVVQRAKSGIFEFETRRRYNSVGVMILR